MILKDFKEDIIYFFSEEYWSLFIEFTDQKMGIINTNASNLPRQGILLRLGIFVFGLFRSAVAFTDKDSPKIGLDDPQKTILILSGSDNEYKSTKFMETYTGGFLLYCGAKKTKGSIPLRVYLIGALFMPLLLARFLCCTPERRNLHKFLGDQFLLVMGWRAIQREIYRTHNVTAVVYSNHLSPVSRSAVVMSRDLSSARVIYVEHTPTMKYFPRIDADIYCLSGQFSLNNLLKRTHFSGKDIFLVGSPKNDTLKYRSHKSNLRHVGLCVSTVDDIVLVREIVFEILSRDQSITLIIRPHPSFKNFEELLNISHPRLLIRSPDQESVKEYLASIGVLIVNDSGVFFEAMLAGVDVIRVKLSCEYLNNYGLPEDFSPLYDKSFRKIADFIRSRRSSSELHRKQIKFFYGNFSTKFDSNATDITFKIVSDYSQTAATIESELHNCFSKTIHDGNRIYTLPSVAGRELKLSVSVES